MMPMRERRLSLETRGAAWLAALLLALAASWLPACGEDRGGPGEAMEELRDEAGDTGEEIRDEVDDAT
jgi:hypothetical protein